MADQRFGRSVTTRRAAAGLTSATGRVACTTRASGWVYAAPGVGLVVGRDDGVGPAAEGRVELGVAVGLGLGSDAAREQPESASRAAAA
jgi:hypothetical protein